MEKKEYLSRKEIPSVLPIDISLSTIDRAIKNKSPMFEPVIFGKRKYYRASTIIKYFQGSGSCSFEDKGNPNAC